MSELGFILVVRHEIAVAVCATRPGNEGRGHEAASRDDSPDASKLCSGLKICNGASARVALMAADVSAAAGKASASEMPIA